MTPISEKGKNLSWLTLTASEVRTGLNGTGAASALVAAVLWFRSARVNIPEATYQRPKENPMYIALHQAARLNGWAAVAAGLAAVCQVALYVLFG